MYSGRVEGYIKVAILVEEIIFLPGYLCLFSNFNQLLWKRTEWNLKDFSRVIAKNEVGDKMAIWKCRANDMQNIVRWRMGLSTFRYI
jgi:hypothetical protein